MKDLKTLQSSGRLEPTFLKKLVTGGSNLTALDLSRDNNEDDHTIVGMVNIKDLGKLRKLNLSGCKGDGLQYVLQNCAMMRSLNLGFMSLTNIHCQLIGGAMRVCVWMGGLRRDFADTKRRKHVSPAHAGAALHRCN